MKFLVIYWDKCVKENFIIEANNKDEVILKLKDQFGINIYIQGHNYNFTSILTHFQAAGYPIEMIVNSYNNLHSPAGFNSSFYDIVCSWE